MRRWSQPVKRRTRTDSSAPIMIFETIVRRSPHTSREIICRKGEPVLDYYSHRSIVDEILYYLPFRDLLQWRATCKELHSKLDFSRLSLRIQPIPSDNGARGDNAEWCLTQVSTGGNILLGGWSCRYRPHSGVLCNDPRHPKRRSVRGCLLIRQVDIIGRCPHDSPLPTEFVRELEDERYTNLMASCYQRRLRMVARGNVLRVNLFPDPEGRYTNLDTSGKHAAVKVGQHAQLQIMVLCDNWQASSQVVVSTRPGMQKQAVVFVIDGREPGTTLLKTPITGEDVSVVYDFSTWRAPPRDLTGWSLDTDTRDSRMSNIVHHAARVVAGGGHIHFLGLHLVNAVWLDPDYPGDHRVPAPNHPDWHPLAVHVSSAILARLTRSGAGSFNQFVGRIHIVPRRVSLEEWGDFLRGPYHLPTAYPPSWLDRRPR